MPNFSVTTAAQQNLIAESNRLDSLTFKNGSSTGIIYVKLTAVDTSTVTSTNYDFSLRAGDTAGLSSQVDGEGIMGPWSFISDTVGGVTLEVLKVYKPTRTR